MPTESLTAKLNPGGRKTVLVTGGAGYIGSHTAKALQEAGYTPVVFDSLINGHRKAVQWGPLVEGDIRDTDAVLACLERFAPVAVIHFAALIEVGESMSRPTDYWDVNLGGTASLVQAMLKANTPHIVMSSTAAVYGTPVDDCPIIEESPLAPINTYGESKLAAERYIASHCRAHGLSGTALRYFNAAGASSDGTIGEAHPRETHLIPLTIEAAMGIGGRNLSLFGNDFSTRDGTCVRDFIHVDDLARAHVMALERTLSPGNFEAFNLGTGIGTSVLEMIETISEHVAPVPYTLAGRRDGDPAFLVASPQKAIDQLGWMPHCSDVASIVRTAHAWRKNPAFGFNS